MLKEILTGENQTVEFKQKLNSPEKIARTISGFANARGGKIFVGIDDNKRVIGVDPDEEIYILEKSAQEFCIPPIQIAIKIKLLGEEYLPVVIAEIPNSTQKPHGVLESKGSVRYYLRAKDQTLPMSDDMLKLLQKGKIEQNEENQAQSGSIEERILKLIDQKGKVKTSEISKAFNLSKYRTSKILFQMLRNGWISKFSTEKEAFFTRL